MRTFFSNSLALAAGAAALAAASPAHAVAAPAVIDWDASPTAFVESLYFGVLGRAPESTAAVAGWASSVTSNPTSRLAVFNGFINSAEYRQRFGDTRGSWGVYYLPQGNVNRWKAATSPGGWHTQRSGISSGYARALVGYYNTYASRR